MEFERINYDELKQIAPFSIYIFEYFRNDFIVIKDFLQCKSPWDKNIRWLLNLNDDELIDKKREMFKSILKVYYDIIETPMFEQEGEEKYINIVDFHFVNAVNMTRNRAKVFYEDDRSATILLRVYLEVLSNKYNIKINTGNYYMYDIVAVINNYSNLLNFYNFDNNFTSGKRYKEFINNLVSIVDQYYADNFRNNDEYDGFINYYFSVVYSYLKPKESKEEIDTVIIDLYEDEEENLIDIFNKSREIRLYFIIKLYDMYIKNGVNFDISYKFNDPEVAKLFKLRDKNYDAENMSDFVIDDFTLEVKMRILLENMFVMPKEEVECILTSNQPIYNFLYNVGLDPRYSFYYKDKIIRKILCDCLTFYNYFHIIDNNYSNEVIKNISNISFKDNSYVDYFKNCFEDIYKFYLEIINDDDYIKEQVYLQNFESNKIKNLEKINNFTIANYFEIFLGKMRRLKSVDYMNIYLNEIEENRDLIVSNEIENERLIRILLLNVYENILLLENMTEEESQVKSVIESVYDISEFVQGNKHFFELLLRLFTKYNEKNITYREEIDKRKILGNSSAGLLLKSLNPYKDE